MMTRAPFATIEHTRLFAAAVVHQPAQAVPLARALLAGGVAVMEVTLRNAHALDCIRRIRAEVPDMVLGAGTILDARQVHEAISAGAVFGVSPGFNPSTIQAARQADFPFMPGVATPGEMEQALQLGCSLVKLFPASVFGPEYIRAVAAPYAHTPLRFAPLGGVTEQNMAEFLKLPLVAAVAGSWLSSPALAAAGRWAEITALARVACARARAGSIDT